ncbi:D-alanyl-D-alanine carboxypeptidase family protein [Atopobiaceae bacterium 24-176]
MTRSRLFSLCFAAALLCALLTPTFSYADVAAMGVPDVTEAQAWCIEDSTGRVLAESNADKAYAPASITKVMCAMVALDAGLPMDTPVTMPALPEEGWEAAQVAGYAEGETASLKDMLEVLLVYSANDAAYAIAEKVGGSQEGFAELMNEKASKIGMTRTTFKNPHGLEEDGHESCARDLVLMGRYALSHYPFIAAMVRTYEVTVPVAGQERTFYSTDELMPVYKPLIGIKTGNVEAGTTFLGAARKDGTTLYSCVLGCATKWGRFEDTRTMMEWAFNGATRVELAQADKVLEELPFAFRFGYALAVRPQADVTGLLWPDGTQCSYTRVAVSPGQLVLPGEPGGACLWRQGGRIVGACAYVVDREVKAAPAWSSNPAAPPFFSQRKAA